MDRNMPIKNSEMVGLELTQEERMLLLAGPSSSCSIPTICQPNCSTSARSLWSCSSRQLADRLSEFVPFPTLLRTSPWYAFSTLADQSSNRTFDQKVSGCENWADQNVVRSFRHR